MNDFRYTAVESPSAAITAVLAERGAKFVAGGTTILDLMKISVETPPLLVDINALPLRGIEEREGGLFIGALERMSDVADDERLRRSYPMVAIALDQSASPQLRNMATIGGNLLQRTRCTYFRDVVTACNKRRPGSGCAAIGGDNRRHAVLGTSDACIATHASDLAVALCALGATVHVTGRNGDRAIPIREFYRTPAQTPQIENVLDAGELVTGVTLPADPVAARSTYVKVRDRAQYDFALASAAAALSIEDGAVRAARVALGGVATVPWHVPESERVLLGEPATRASFERAAAAAVDGARGYGKNDFKVVLAQRALVRALEIVAES